MKLLEGALGISEQALSVRTRRMEVLARNIANADTPNFKAQDIDFKSVLAEVGTRDTSMAATRASHYSDGEMPGADGLRYRIPFNTAMDGNTVEISVEQANYGKAAAEYQATLSFLESRISGIRKALKGE
jgi:flagellar basal-body rod protein FlgB